VKRSLTADFPNAIGPITANPRNENMNIPEEPLVSVVTPVYNGEDFLEECIESVLKQTYRNYEYIIVNNCSTDHSLEIALNYSKRDSRLRVHSNTQFVGVIENHNIAFRLISPDSKYCKVVSADDWLFPECLARMVGIAEANPSVGFVGSYQLSGDSIRWQGFPYPKTFLPGREMCRLMFLGDNHPTFGLGSPTSLLYRADLVRNSEDFYPNPSPHADTSACFAHLKDCDYGFVYQVLCYERVHAQTQSHESSRINRYAGAWLNDILTYGRLYLSEEEFATTRDEWLRYYYGYLASNLLKFRGKDFWNYHKSSLQELGYPISKIRLLGAGMLRAIWELMNPERAVRKLWKRVHPMPNV
jgi:glycosyltransferase involved in cell wall biosynthesis